LLFRVIEPSTAETPVVVEIPHAGLDVPAHFRAPLIAPVRALARDADLYVDELYQDAPLEGATLVVASTSRYLLDLNRGEDEIDGNAVAGARSEIARPRGLVWSLTTDGERVLSRPLDPAELDERLDAVHRPYHRALREILARKKKTFGHAVLLAAHSMPSVGRSAHGDPGSQRADVVPGTQGRTTAHGRLIDAVEKHARQAGMSVRHDDPYRGGFSTRTYGRPSEAVHAVQVELARRLYMDEITLKQRPHEFETLRGWCRALVRALASVGLR
jgi:N-formylglutamate amidohydrolase